MIEISIMTFVIFIWLIMPIIGLFIGKTKGHGFLGFILGFLLGPIGLVIIAIMKPDNISDSRRGPELNVEIIPEEKKKKVACPFCGLGFIYNTDEKAKCPGCSRIITNI